MQKLEIYTDGASSPKKRFGGYGAVLVKDDGIIKMLFGGTNNTTNNRMELMGPIEMLESLAKPLTLKLYTDSKYVQDGITSWIKKWKQNGWTSQKWNSTECVPVKNKDLWIRLDKLNQIHNIEWCWVKGHSGNKYNEIVDQLAVCGKEDAMRMWEKINV